MFDIALPLDLLAASYSLLAVIPIFFLFLSALRTALFVRVKRQ